MEQVPTIKKMAFDNNESIIIQSKCDNERKSNNKKSIIIEGINDFKSKCNIKNCNSKYKYHGCNKMHQYQIKECLDVYSLTDNIERAKRLAYRMTNDFNEKKKEIEINNIKFTSSGVLLFRENLIYLFQNSSIVRTKPNRGCYYNGMTKGRIEECDSSLEITASREVYEESCKTIMIPTEILSNSLEEQYVNVDDHNKNYRIYFCELSEEIPDIVNNYTNNLEFIEDTQENSCYHETNKIHIFNINDVIMKIKNTEFLDLKPDSCKDINGDTRIIDRKTIKAIFKYYMESKSTIKLDKYEIIREDLITTIKFNSE